MTDDDLIHHLTALRQQIDELTTRLHACLGQRAHVQHGSAAALELVSQIYQAQTDIADLQADLRQVQPGRVLGWGVQRIQGVQAL